MADTNFYPSIPAKKLKTDILSTDSIFKLRDIKWYTGSDGVDVNLTSSVFGTGNVGYGVFEPNTSRQEFFTFDPTNMAVATTTGLTILLRGLPWGSDYTTELASRKFNHASGAAVILLTNAPHFYNQFANKGDDETITGVWTFTSTAKAKYNAHPTFSADEEMIDKKYADDLAIAGAPDSSETVKGLVESATQTEVNEGDNTGTTTAPTVVRPAQLATAIQRATYTFAIDAGASDAYAVTMTPAITAYFAGASFRFDANTPNTGAASLAVNALGAKSIKKYVNGAIADLETNDIIAGMIVDVSYDGTQFIMQTPVGTGLTSAVSSETQTFFGATNITGAEAETLTNGSNADTLHIHLYVPYFEILIGEGFSTEQNTQQQVAFSPDYSDMYWARGGSGAAIVIYRFSRESTTGMYYYTGTTGNTAANFSTSVAGIYATATYVYAVGRNSATTDMKVSRFARDLTGETVFTIAGVANANLTSAVCGNDSTFFVFSDGVNTTVFVYTLSGTTATRGADITIAAQGQYVRGVYYDGTDIVLYDELNGNVRRYNTAGVQQAAQTRILWPTAATTQSERGYPVGVGAYTTGQIYVVGVYTISDEAANTGLLLKGFALDKP